MSLSQWATLALTLDGTVIDTVSVDWPTSPAGVRFEIRKNWLNAIDARAWRPNGLFTDDVVIFLQHGELAYVDWKIFAIRGPQDGIYVAAWWTTGEGDGPTGEIVYHGFVACGVNGFSDTGEWVGVKPGSLEYFKRWLARSEKPYSKEDYAAMLEVPVEKVADDEFEAWLRAVGPSESLLPDAVAKVPFDKAESVNQGDAFFARNIPKLGEPGFDPEKAR